MHSLLPALALLPAALAIAIPSQLSPRSNSGQATYYGGNVAGGACSFSTYTLPAGLYGTALSDSNWDNSANCGACVSVTGPSGNSITAMIVDECPGCGLNHLDLFPDAFSALAPQSEGVISVSWDFVDCPITSPLELHNKDGVSPYWFSMQVVNADEGVSSLEVSTDGGSTWEETTRQTYNFFEISSGTGTSTVDVKVTGADGAVVVVDGVGISSDSSVTASSNFAVTGATATTGDSTSTSTTATSVPATSSTAAASSSDPATSSTADPSSGDSGSDDDEDDDDTCEAE